MYRDDMIGGDDSPGSTLIDKAQGVRPQRLRSKLGGKAIGNRRIDRASTQRIMIRTRKDVSLVGGCLSWSIKQRVERYGSVDVVVQLLTFRAGELGHTIYPDR